MALVAPALLALEPGDLGFAEGIPAGAVLRGVLPARDTWSVVLDWLDPAPAATTVAVLTAQPLSESFVPVSSPVLVAKWAARNNDSAGRDAASQHTAEPLGSCLIAGAGAAGVPSKAGGLVSETADASRLATTALTSVADEPMFDDPKTPLFCTAAGSRVRLEPSNVRRAGLLLDSFPKQVHGVDVATDGPAGYINAALASNEDAPLTHSDAMALGEQKGQVLCEPLFGASARAPFVRPRPAGTVPLSRICDNSMDGHLPERDLFGAASRKPFKRPRPVSSETTHDHYVPLIKAGFEEGGFGTHVVFDHAVEEA